MSRRIEKTRRAETDIDEVFTYLGGRNWDAAQRFLSAVENDCNKLTEMPGLGDRRSFRRTELRELRSLPVSGFENYLLFYLPLEDGIRVVRVVHGARDLDRLFRQT